VEVDVLIIDSAQRRSSNEASFPTTIKALATALRRRAQSRPVAPLGSRVHVMPATTGFALVRPSAVRRHNARGLEVALSVSRWSGWLARALPRPTQSDSATIW
jgi:hypothetical protein